MAFLISGYATFRGFRVSGRKRIVIVKEFGGTSKRVDVGTSVSTNPTNEEIDLNASSP